MTNADVLLVELLNGPSLVGDLRERVRLRETDGRFLNHYDARIALVALTDAEKVLAVATKKPGIRTLDRYRLTPLGRREAKVLAGDGKPKPKGPTTHKDIDTAVRKHGPLSLGRCPDFCSDHKDLKPIAYGWSGTALASSKACPFCNKPLVRIGRGGWLSVVRVVE